MPHCGRVGRSGHDTLYTHTHCPCILATLVPHCGRVGRSGHATLYTHTAPASLPPWCHTVAVLAGPGMPHCTHTLPLHPCHPGATLWPCWQVRACHTVHTHCPC